MPRARNLQALDSIARMIAPYGPVLPPDRMVEEINLLYHAAEAKSYDATHPEIFDQLPPLWMEMCAVARSNLGPSGLKILDFGCGTGFEAVEMIENFGADSVEDLVCFDPSREMLERCRVRLKKYSARVSFIGNLDELDGAARFNLLATNSVLHHLPNPVDVIDRLRDRVEPGALWLVGHEPSARYFKNAECQAAYRRFWRSYRTRRMMDPRAYWERLREWIGCRTGHGPLAAKLAVERGLFRRRPRAFVIDRMVDLHVAHSVDEAHSGRGLDYRELEQSLEREWRLEWVKSYSYMGPFTESQLPRRWQRIAAELAQRHPEDGANFCSVWRSVR